MAFSDPFAPLVRATAGALTGFNTAIALEHPADSADHMHAYWHTSPEFFVVEWAIVHLLLLVPGFWVLSGYASSWPEHIPAARPRQSGPARGVDALINALERAASAALAACGVLVLCFKTFLQPFAYICMPCHLHTLLLIYLRYGAPADARRGRLFHAAFLASGFGTVLALLFPDCACPSISRCVVLSRPSVSVLIAMLCH